ncbi:hypothetical protein O6P43_001719 [Quillaja saponaria]|uniref:Uncharacterized protein n=1 Tax=Quillaja saponaria TaxID=32244 RepID=A0AAD7QJC7_QUISA|nr:hypothetical protein O6P43_001719 [Quillaja saponaria]
MSCVKQHGIQRSGNTSWQLLWKNRSSMPEASVHVGVDNFFLSIISRARGHQKGKAKGKYRRQADDNVEDEDDDDESDEDLGDDD